MKRQAQNFKALKTRDIDNFFKHVTGLTYIHYARFADLHSGAILRPAKPQRMLGFQRAKFSHLYKCNDKLCLVVILNNDSCC